MCPLRRYGVTSSGSVAECDGVDLGSHSGYALRKYSGVDSDDRPAAYRRHCTQHPAAQHTSIRNAAARCIVNCARVELCASGVVFAASSDSRSFSPATGGDHGYRQVRSGTDVIVVSLPLSFPSTPLETLVVACTDAQVEHCSSTFAETRKSVGSAYEHVF